MSMVMFVLMSKCENVFSNLADVHFRSCKVKALMKESAWLEEHLPVHPDASIFVRQVSLGTGNQC